MNTISAWLERAPVAFGIIFFVLLFAYVGRYLRGLWWSYKRQITYLELTPPAFTYKSPLGTAQLFKILHGFGDGRSLVDRILNRKPSFSLEIVSSRKDGIRYVLGVASSEAAQFHQIITAYLPEVKVREISNFLPEKFNNMITRVMAFKQAKHFALPVASQELLKDHDPIAYLTSAMTKLKPNELMAFQLVLTPIHSQEADVIASKALSNEDLLAHLSGRDRSAIRKLFKTVNRVLFMVIDTISGVWHGSPPITNQINQKDAHDKQQIALRIKPARTLSSFEQALVESINDKVQQPLYRVSIRALIAVDSKQEARQRLKAVRASMASFKVPKYQYLKPLKQLRGKTSHKYGVFLFRYRLRSLMRKSDSLLAASEVAGLYHFPYAATTKTENITKSLSRTLPAPVSLKGSERLDILLGENHHHGSSTPIGLTESERERHIYIIGGTGNGKTTMLLYAITQDIQAGKGIAVIDPHGDLSESILRRIPKERIEDVIYMNPDDISHPIGLNLLELPPGLTGDDLLREKDIVTESTISVMRKMFSDDDSGGHRIEYILRNTIQTALTLEGATLFTIFHLLNDTKYRRTVVRSLKDKDLKNFWKNELGKAGDFQKVKMTAGITAKVGRFLFSASAKRVLEQEKSTIDFDEILNSGKILICNFSKGLLGEDTSTLFGTTVLAKLQMASLKRARLKQDDRRPMHLYVDEFQNFATMSFVQMLSEARKYRLFLTMAEQSTSQQEQQRLVDIILANVGTIICFRSGSPADERLVLPLFSPYIDQGEIANLPSFNFYMRIAAVTTQEPLSGVTKLLDTKGSDKVAMRVKEASRNRYAIVYKERAEVVIEQDSKNTSSKSQSDSKHKLQPIQDTVAGSQGAS